MHLYINVVTFCYHHRIQSFCLLLNLFVRSFVCTYRNTIILPCKSHGEKKRKKKVSGDFHCWLFTITHRYCRRLHFNWDHYYYSNATVVCFFLFLLMSWIFSLLHTENLYHLMAMASFVRTNFSTDFKFFFVFDSISHRIISSVSLSNSPVCELQQHKFRKRIGNVRCTYIQVYIYGKGKTREPPIYIYI